jgi:hypothetical protein
MSDRLEEIERMTNRPDAYGFRSECRELVRMCRALLAENKQMRSVKVQADWGPLIIAEHCDRIGRTCDSSLHEAAALMIHRLMREAAEAKDAAADGRVSP